MALAATDCAVGALIVVALGPLTNEALACHLEHRLGDLLVGLIAVGGAATALGNTAPFAGANIHSDPHPADLFFAAGSSRRQDGMAGFPTTLVPLDVTKRGLLTGHGTKTR